MIKNFLFSKQGFWTTTILFIVFLVGVLPSFSSLSTSVFNTSFTPDTSLFYSPEQFYEAMHLYGQTGRSFYIWTRWTFDVVWPLVYLSFFIVCIAQLKAHLTLTHRRIVFMFPIIGAGFDFLENTLATINVALYPERSLFLLRLLQGASILKWGFIGLSILGLIYLIVLHMLHRSQR